MYKKTDSEANSYMKLYVYLMFYKGSSFLQKTAMNFPYVQKGKGFAWTNGH